MAESKGPARTLAVMVVLAVVRAVNATARAMVHVARAAQLQAGVLIGAKTLVDLLEQGPKPVQVEQARAVCRVLADEVDETSPMQATILRHIAKTARTLEEVGIGVLSARAAAVSHEPPTELDDVAARLARLIGLPIPAPTTDAPAAAVACCDDAPPLPERPYASSVVIDCRDSPPAEVVVGGGVS